jgi:drug/metabolite transporter (DMT)-like permease
MWAVEPLLISSVNGLPIFELLTIIFLSSFAMTAVRITWNKKWRLVLKQSAFIWLAGFAGICVSDFAYIYGSQYAPIAHIDLIDYIWPCLGIFFTSLLPKEKLKFQHFLGGLMGFAGIYFLIGPELQTQGISGDYMLGYILAIVGAVFWGGYTAFTRYHLALPTEMVGMYCGLGAVVCFILHLNMESFVMPSLEQGSLSVLTGLTGAGLAYQLWDYGVKHGEVYLLNILTYVARIVAMVLLVVMGKEPFSWGLVAACGLASLGVLVSTMDAKLFIAWLKKTFSTTPEHLPETTCFESERIESEL